MTILLVYWIVWYLYCISDHRVNLFHSHHRVCTEWQRPLSGVHTIMMEKFAHAGEGGRCTPTPFHYIYHHVQSWMSAERACTLPLFLLYPYIYSERKWRNAMCTITCVPVLCHIPMTHILYSRLCTLILVLFSFFKDFAPAEI